MLSNVITPEKSFDACNFLEEYTILHLDYYENQKEENIYAGLGKYPSEKEIRKYVQDQWQRSDPEKSYYLGNIKYQNKLNEPVNQEIQKLETKERIEKILDKLGEFCENEPAQ